MRWERTVCLICVIASIGLASSPGMAVAGLLFLEDFSSHPDLSSGNWHSNITYSGDPASVGTWDTSGGYAAATTDGTGSVGYTSANAQRMFTSAEKAAFGGLYDSGTGMIGGGNVSGSVYVRFDGSIAGTQDPTYSAGFGWFELRRGSAPTVETLETAGGGSGLKVGKEWGRTVYSSVVMTNPVVHSDLNAIQAVVPGNHSFVMRYDFASGAADSVTIYKDPIVATEGNQPNSLVTTYSAVGDLSFDSFLLRCGNQGTSWNFDTIKFGSSFGDVTTVPAPEPSAIAIAVTGLIGMLAYAWRKRK
jgi:hypothetical protein